MSTNDTVLIEKRRTKTLQSLPLRKIPEKPCSSFVYHRNAIIGFAKCLFCAPVVHGRNSGFMAE